MLGKLTAQHKKAATLLAEDALSDEKIALAVGVSRNSLSRWKKLPHFAEHVEKLSENLSERALQHGISRRDNRLKVLQEAHNRVLQIIDERAADPAMALIPGGKTGLIVRNFKSVGWGDSSRVVEEYSVDTALLRELRALHESAAKEMGQWVDKKEINGHVDLTIDFLDEILHEETTYLDAEICTSQDTE